jgi:hypothetical protein
VHPIEHFAGLGDLGDGGDLALSVPPEALDAIGVEGADQLWELQEAVAEHERGMQQAMTNLLDEQGATELVTAIKSGGHQGCRARRLAFFDAAASRPRPNRRHRRWWPARTDVPPDPDLFARR